MADFSHLEKMGRELKCPICLSLFDTAVSLTCNHVFCNSCIHKFMRSGSNCPVCKVPYQRREIRPAPHMDSLVNIYKSMEAASGHTLFVSQNGPTTNLADAVVKGNGELASMRKTREETPETVKHQRRNRGSPIASELKPKRSTRNRGKSSCPTNKRVQVPESPVTETPTRHEKDGIGQNIVINNPVNKCSASLSEQKLSTEKKILNLSPFFWLQEEVERSSQRTVVDEQACTPLKAPCFSDLKDSDDDVPPENSLEVEPVSKRNEDMFDSEMFEWTQRECSPELCSSPFKKQVVEIVAERMLGKKSEALFTDRATDIEVVREQRANVSAQETYTEHHNNAYPVSTSEDRRNACRMPCKGGGKESKERQKKNMEVGEAHNGPKTPNDFMQCQGLDTEIVLGSSRAAGTSKTRHIQSLDAKLINAIDDHAVDALTPALGKKKSTQKIKKLENMKRTFDSIEHRHESNLVKKKKQKKNLAQIDPSRELNVSPCGRCEDAEPEPNSSNDNPCRAVKRSNSCSTSHKTKEIRQLTSVFGQKIADGVNNVHIKAVAHVLVNDVQGKSSNNIEKVHCQKDKSALRKCDRVLIKCAFCHSSEETENSGEMVHYCEGRSVFANHTGGPVIHSHKDCTEWAPNVYFENHIAVNLEEELARSCRIKCSLCEVKGAALGCYEKSCRKSFHVPCAKKLKECRWDNDHFVILCPLHASSKLPCELPISQVRKRKSNPQGKTSCQRYGVAFTHVNSSNGWNCGRPSDKLVLCCSALSMAEKEAVSELAKSSGAVVWKSWNPSVTHVIASTNENGACKRTLKVLMGILEGKWILNFKWVQACMEAMKLIEETPYEIACDIHGVWNGPRLGRLRFLNEQPKLFAGFSFYFTGDFEASYKGYLQDLVSAAGGTVLHRKPVAETPGTGASSSSKPSIVIVYSIELPGNSDLGKKDLILQRRCSDAEALAITSGAKVANNSWVLNCIAGHKLQDL